MFLCVYKYDDLKTYPRTYNKKHLSYIGERCGLGIKSNLLPNEIP